MPRERDLLRDPSGPQHVTFLELYFDLVFVFALERVSQGLVDHLRWTDLVETLVLLPAIWWIWMMTVWMTDRFDPSHPSTQLVVIGIMLVSLVVGAAVPGAFDDASWIFAGGYVAIQLGRSLYLTVALRDRTFRRRGLRTMCWFLISAVPWLLGAALPWGQRLALWTIAVLIDYAAARLDFPTPGLGRSRTSEWWLAAEHTSERYRQIIIIALGGDILVAGTTFGAQPFGPDSVAALVVSFSITGLLWRIYIYRAGELMSDALAMAEDPAHLGRSAAYTHLLLAAASVAVAVTAKLVIAAPLVGPHRSWSAAIIAGPVLFLLGRARLEYTVFSRVALSRIIGLAAIAATAPAMLLLPPLFVAGTMVLILAGVAAGDVAGWLRNPSVPRPPPRRH